MLNAHHLRKELKDARVRLYASVCLCLLLILTRGDIFS